MITVSSCVAKVNVEGWMYCTASPMTSLLRDATGRAERCPCEVE